MLSRSTDRAFLISLALILTFFIGFSNQTSTAWQSYGNFTEDNITFINTTINNVVDNASLVSVNLWPGPISDALNKQWDPAWNVIIVQKAEIANTDYAHNTIVYGYAFRGHWLWFNRLKLVVTSNINYYYSFIIWKDYNCHTWTTFTSTTVLIGSTKKGIIRNTIRSLAANQPSLVNDTWMFGYQAVTEIEKLYPN